MRLILIHRCSWPVGYVADDGTEFINPVAGLLIYDFEEDPITVELCGIDNDIWGHYFD